MYRLDAARLYRLALDRDTAGGRYHGVADVGVAIRDIGEIIGKRLRVVGRRAGTNVQLRS